MGGGLGALQFFWSLKKGTRTFHFGSNEPSRKILGPLGRYDHPWKKKTKTNKHASVICLLAKNTKFHIFLYELETSTVGLSDTMNLMV